MDDFKRETIVDYTVWDLNVKCIKNDNKMEHRCKRKARRKARRKLAEVLNKELYKDCVDES